MLSPNSTAADPAPPTAPTARARCEPVTCDMLENLLASFTSGQYTRRPRLSRLSQHLCALSPPCSKARRLPVFRARLSSFESRALILPCSGKCARRRGYVEGEEAAERATGCARLLRRSKGAAIVSETLRDIYIYIYRGLIVCEVVCRVTLSAAKSVFGRGPCGCRIGVCCNRRYSCCSSSRCRCVTRLRYFWCE